MKCIKRVTLAILVLLVAGAALLYAGVYPIEADRPHHPVTHWLLETLRDRSVQRAAAGIAVPGDLDQPDRLLAGGADYNAMCAGCHLKPGVETSDLARGLYPSPPNLTEPHTRGGSEEDVLKRRFWVIKHGIKASGMPAWGPTHSDERIWNMVAFLRRLPELTPPQYQILTARRAYESGH